MCQYLKIQLLNYTSIGTKDFIRIRLILILLIQDIGIHRRDVYKQSTSNLRSKIRKRSYK